MKAVEVIQGEKYRDFRGIISSLNSFRFDGINRFYFIQHPDETIIRGWHGHQHEKKWFYCVKGAFTLGLVKIDNWEKPSLDLPAEIFELNEQDSRIVCVPEGYANCLKASIKDSVMLVFPSKVLADALSDSWRYDNALWVDWTKY